MKRRAFFGTSAGAAALAGLGGGTASAAGNSVAGGTELAGCSLQKLREEHRYWLFDDFLPFLEKHVVDHEYGGFMCTADRDGTRISEEKRGWYEGRGIWVYSFLYNHLAREQKNLDIAEKSVKFIMKHRPSGDNLWPETYNRDGSKAGQPDERLYGELFIALGLQEFSKATGDDAWWRLAKDTLLKDVRFYDRPDYLKDGQRVQGVWMCLINTITAMLEHRRDAELEAVMDRSLDAVLKYHYNPDCGLNNEVINHDLSRRAETAQAAYPGHSIETFWMIMYEAVRRKDKTLFQTAYERFRRHVEIAWDDVYGGVFAGLDHIDENRWMLNKVLWAQEEVLIGALFAWEHTGDEWAREWYGRMYDYVLDKFPLKQYGFPIWNLAADRKVTFVRHYNRVGNFHHPRHLMFNMLTLDRIIKRNGRASGIFG